MSAPLVVGAIYLSLTPRHLERFAILPEMLAETWEKRPYIISSLRYLLVSGGGREAARVTTGGDLITLIALIGCMLAPFLRPRRLEAGVLLLGLAIVAEFSLILVIASTAYAARQGVLTIAPHLVVALYALAQAWRTRNRTLLHPAIIGILSFVFMIAVIFTTRIGYDGDYLIGLEGAARYFLPLYPLWTALTVVAVVAYRGSERPPLLRSGVSLIVAFMAILAIAYQARGLLALAENRRQILAWQEALPDQTPVVTNLWWLAALVAPYFTQHEMYCVSSPEQMVNWAALAQAHDVTEFTYAAREAAEVPLLPLALTSMQRGSERPINGLRLVRFHVGDNAAR
jgi:hypothetical protein